MRKRTLNSKQDNIEDLEKRWKHRWLTSKAKPFKSKIHGIGLIATGPIEKGEIIQVIGGIIVPRSEILEYRKIMGHIGLQIHDDFFLVPASRKEVEEYGAPNHSCDPNIGLKGPNIYVAIRDIKPGEEIVLDYAFMETYFEPFKCKCGSKNCRGIITPNDWKKKGLQEKYFEYLSPYLKEKISKQSKE